MAAAMTKQERAVAAVRVAQTRIATTADLWVGDIDVDMEDSDGNVWLMVRVRIDSEDIERVLQ